MSRIITHEGQRYDLDELAFFMEDHDREYVHGIIDAGCTAQEYWDAFVRTFPGGAGVIVQRAKAISE